MKVCAIVSGGKDSLYALYLAIQQGFEVTSVVTFIAHRESWMLHIPNVKWVELQTKLMGLKHNLFYVSGEREKEVEEMKEKLKEAVKEEKIEALVCGAIKSEYQKHRIDMICEELGIISYSPLWHKNAEILLKEIVEAGFRFMVTRVAAEGIERWLGIEINEENVDEFINNLKVCSVDVCGEGGEYETFVVEAPIFKGRLEVEKGRIIEDCLAKEFVIEKIECISKL
jgi:ABC transporter with metal-binding/Fe-S-binding domain ATP-binding protein